ncbi:acyltransferase family protein [Rhodococcus sp. ANT_H53B]|uniref:acyltransferase family protein n=1 Tax=Rhodococcus sp. ANT_H53B TaxID=2597357 RepID=UPI0011F06BD9|nr:acyltransferase family protein [Rhodococcus sp. ANT_H53B]KAA0923619.1 acyltransferase [Rhodococcus sp. ANT_H53B]
MSEVIGKSKFRTDIEGMRAIAILSVLTYHAGAPFLPGGYIGVDVFFVISGFLITSHLLSETKINGRVLLIGFYARRMRRLLPASLLVLVVTLILARLLLPPLAMQDVSRDGMFTATYLSNMWFAYTGTDYLANDTPSVFQHYWSLALEEQFYLVWPVLIILVTALSRKRTVMVAAIALVSAASFLFGLSVMEINQPMAFFSLPTRAWELGVGGLVAASMHLLRRVNIMAAAGIAWAGLAMVGGAAVFYDSSTVFPGVAAALPVVGAAAMIVGGTVAAGMGPGRFLQAPLFQFFGRISYSLYLWHWPLLVVPSLYRAELSAWTRIALCGVAIALAVATEKYVERPFRKRPAQQMQIGRSYGTAGAATAVALSLALVVGVMPRLDTDRVANTWPATAMPSDVAVGGSVPINIRPALEQARDSIPSIYADGCHLGFEETIPRECVFGDVESSKSIVLFGDSHAAQWFPALTQIAHDEGKRLVSLTKSACPSADIASWNSTLQTPYIACDQWREIALETINRLRPDLVVISNSQQQITADGYDVESAWQSGLQRTIARVPGGTRVVVLGDGPMFEIAPTMCLSMNLSSVAACDRPADEVISIGRMASDQAAAANSGAQFIDTREWYCPDGICTAQRGDVALYRDNHHITVEFAQALAPALRLTLDGLGFSS